MNFTATLFFAFVAIVLAVYLRLPRRAQNIWLLASSLFFYFVLCDVPRFAWCLLLSIATEFVSARRIAAAPDKATKRRWLALSVTVELSVLGFFKLHDFFAASVREVFLQLGLAFPWHVEHIGLPLAISFYTFQCLGYTLDVYRGRAKPETDLVDFALFVTFFAKLVAGPIERAGRLLPQIKGERTPTLDGFLSGSWLVFLGVYKKLAIADQLTPVVAKLLPVQAHYRGLDVWVGTALAAFAIYADFSGYTDVMRGIGRWFGFELSPNFKAPFFARNIQEYWRRWHMTLTGWITDYVYMPMVLSKRWSRLGSGGLAIVTMLVMGFWHGAKVTFLLWGLWHGVLIALYGRARPWLYRHATFTSPLARSACTIAATLFTFHCLVIGGVLFNARQVSTAYRMLHDLVWNPSASPEIWVACTWALLRCAPVLALDWIEHRTNDSERFLTAPLLVRRAAQALMVGYLLDGLLSENPSPPFHYF